MIVAKLAVIFMGLFHDIYNLSFKYRSYNL